MYVFPVILACVPAILAFCLEHYLVNRRFERISTEISKITSVKATATDGAAASVHGHHNKTTVKNISQSSPIAIRMDSPEGRELEKRIEEGEKFKTKVENVDCTSLSEKDLSSLQKELSAWISDTERDLRTVGEAFVQRFRVTDKRQSSIRLGCDSLGIMELDNQVEMYLNNLRNMTQ